MTKLDGTLSWNEAKKAFVLVFKQPNQQGKVESKKPTVESSLLADDLREKARNGTVDVTFQYADREVTAVWDRGGAEPTEEELALAASAPRRARIEASQASVAAAALEAEKLALAGLPASQAELAAAALMVDGNPDNRFLNPYAYVQTRGRGGIAGGLGDAKPVGKARWHEDRWTGRLIVEMTAQAPLLICDEAHAVHQDVKSGKHSTYRMLSRGTGATAQAILPASIIKGLLSADYEAVTNSRYRVFRNHDLPLGRRMETDEAKGMVPARVTKDGHYVELFEGFAGSVPAAWLPYYKKEPKNPRDSNSQLHLARRVGTPKHGEHVVVTLDKYKRYSPQKDREGRPVMDASGKLAYVENLTLWRVRDGSAVATSVGSDTDREMKRALAVKLAGLLNDVRDLAVRPGAKPPNLYVCCGDSRVVSGWVVVTGPNIGNKHDERIFFNDPSVAHTPMRLKITAEVRRNWRAVLKSYRDNKLGGPTTRSRTDGRMELEYSRHFAELAALEELKDEPFVYAEYSGTTLGRMVPVPIARAIYPASPAELLPQCLHPATALAKLSPADRLFGWVADGGGGGAWKGCLRVQSISTPSGSIEELVPPLPLPILGTPKNYGRFALAAVNTNGTVSTLSIVDSKKEFFNGQSVLRRDEPEATAHRLSGRKVYWTHHRTPADWAWNGPVEHGAVRAQHAEYRRAPKPERGTSIEQRDRFNRSVRAWVKRGTTFTVTLDVSDVSAVELGALLWLLQPHQLVKRALGYGKPVGYGAVSWQLDPERSVVKNGSEIAASYDDVSNAAPVSSTVLTADTVAWLVEQFRLASRTAWGAPTIESSPHVQDYLAVARGLARFPVHYPRQTPQPTADGENYKWFMENEKEGKRHPLERPSAKHPSLPLEP